MRLPFPYPFTCLMVVQENSFKHARQHNESPTEKDFWGAQSSLSAAEFETFIQSMGKKGLTNFADYLSKVDDTWKLYEWADMGLLTYGLKTSNLSEIDNSSCLKIRDMPPCQMFCALILKRMKKSYDESEEAARLYVEAVKPGETLTPYAHKKCEDAVEESQTWQVLRMTPTECLVSKKDGPCAQQYRVRFPTAEKYSTNNPDDQLAHDIVHEPSCDCKVPQTQGLYCRHAVAAERAYFNSQQSSASSQEHMIPLSARLLEWVHSSHLVSTWYESTKDITIRPIMVRDLHPSNCYPHRTAAAMVTKGPVPRKRLSSRWLGSGWGAKAKRIFDSKECDGGKKKARVDTEGYASELSELVADVGPYQDIQKFSAINLQDLEEPLSLTGKTIAHIFNTGWALGTVKGQRKKSGYWEVKYSDDGNRIWRHCLNKEDYGIARSWVVVQKK